MSNSLDCVDIVSKFLDKGLSMDILYNDFQKAFDSVTHKILLKNMEAYRIRGPVLLSERAFLENSTFQVKICDDLSGSRHVPQGNQKYQY